MNGNKILKLGFYRPICNTQFGLLCFKHNKLYLYKQNNFSFLCHLKIIGWRGFFSFNRLSTRITHRFAYCGINPINTSYALLAANDGIYKVSLNRKEEIKRIFNFNIPDMHRPLALFEIHDVDGFENSVCFGDYCYNKERKPISIYSFNLSTEIWTKKYTFKEGSIRHIHSVISDPFRNRVLVLTGDKDNESGIWIIKEGFKKVTNLFQGDQKYRFCACKVYQDKVALVTDSPFDQNYLYYLISDKNNQESLVPIFKIPGPTVFFSINYDNDLFFATDVENDEKNLTPLQEFFINKKGDGVLDDFSHLFRFDGENLSEIARFKKDALPMRIFGFGTIHIPSGPFANDSIFVYPMAVKKYDQCLLEVHYGEN